MTTSPFAERLQQFTGGSVHLARIAIIVISFLANVVVWLIARAFDANLLATGMGADSPVKIGILELLFGSLTWGIGALMVFAIIELFSSDSSKGWKVVAAITGILLVLAYFGDPVSGLVSGLVVGIILNAFGFFIVRFAPEPRKCWFIVAVIALAFSFVFIFTGAENSATVITFSIMHLVAAAIIIPGLAATLRR